MSLITRCPACGTMFKVVTDQLKVSRGWVRCGRCAHVFDAPLNLQPAGAVPSLPAEAPLPEASTSKATAPEPPAQIELPAPSEPVEHPEQVKPFEQPSSPGVPARPVPVARVVPRWISGQAAPASAAVQDVVVSATNSVDSPPDSAADFDPAAWREAQKRRHLDQSGYGHSLPAPLGITKPASLESSEFAAARSEAGDSAIDLPMDSSSLVSAGPTDEGPLAGQPATVRTETPDETYVRYDFDSSNDFDQSDLLPASKEMSFVREARRKAFWSRRRVRAGLVALSAVMVVMLVFQWALQRRDDLAAVNPALASLLQGACSLTGCEIRPPRHIDSLVIDSSTFNRIATDAYRLTFVIKNTGSIPVEVPSLEVTLTDPQDQALIRRVVIPAQFGVSTATLAARSDVSGSLSIKVTTETGPPNGGASAAAGMPAASPLPVAGYRLVAFYP